MSSLVDLLATGEDFPLTELQAIVTDGLRDGLSRETLERLAGLVLVEVANDDSFSYVEKVRAAELHNVMMACIADTFTQLN
jgi:hypothetical protein